MSNFSGADFHVERLIESRVELLEEVRKIEAMIRAAGAKIPRGAAQERKGTEGTSKRKRSGSGIGIAAEKVEAVFAVVQSLGVPTSTADIATKVDGLGQSAVGKALSHLVKERRIRHAGYMPGVKGKRPLYAPWPSDATMSEEPYPALAKFADEAGLPDEDDGGEDEE